MVSKERDFSLLENSDIVDDIPNRIWFKSEGKQKEVFDFFDKIPINKAMRVKFPDASTWKIYGQRLRFFAGYYQNGKTLIISSRSNGAGYYIFVKKHLSEVTENGKGLEIKGI